MRELFRRSWVPPIMLLLISILAYGILLPTLGFYWDDMPKLWFLHRFGPSGFHQVYEIDRPFLAWTYRATTLIIGESALSWQLFGLISHWMSAAAFWWMLRTVWPMRVQEAFWGAALFLVYPGFSRNLLNLQSLFSHLRCVPTVISFDDQSGTRSKATLALHELGASCVSLQYVFS